MNGIVETDEKTAREIYDGLSDDRARLDLACKALLVETEKQKDPARFHRVMDFVATLTGEPSRPPFELFMGLSKRAADAVVAHEKTCGVAVAKPGTKSMMFGGVILTWEDKN